MASFTSWPSTTMHPSLTKEFTSPMTFARDPFKASCSSFCLMMAIVWVPAKKKRKSTIKSCQQITKIASEIQHYIHGNPHCYAPLCLSLFTLHRWLVPLIPLAHSLCSAPYKTFTNLLLLHPPSLIPFEVQTFFFISHTWAWQTVLSIFHQWEGADEKTCAVRHSCPITCNFDLDGPSGTRVVFQLEKKNTFKIFVVSRVHPGACESEFGHKNYYYYCYDYSSTTITTTTTTTTTAYVHVFSFDAQAEA